MKNIVKACVIFVIIAIHTPETFSSKILVLAPFFGKSHSIFIHSIVTELANRNHEIVIITTNPIKDAPSNIRQVLTLDKTHEKLNPAFMFEMMNVPIAFMLPIIWMRCITATENYMSSANVQSFIKENNNTFDLVMSELFFQDAFYMFAHKYQAPLVVLDTSTYLSVIDDMMGHDSSLSYIRNEFSKGYGDMTFLQRLENHFIGNILKWVHRLYMRRQHQRIASENFSDLPQPLPSIEQLEKNASLVLMNTHYSFDIVRPLVPGVVEVGGIHVKPAKPLPNNIKSFLDGAKDGAIYFSLGSHLQSSLMPEKIKKVFFNVFKRVNLRILWKFESDLPEDLPNVMISKWLPQTDILAHPNIRLFISHGGMLGTQEAISRGVPVLGISLYGDQHQNMDKLMSLNMAIHVLFSEITEVKIENALNAILTNKSYSENAKLISKRYHDQQNTPMEKAMFWIEYVIRHKGAPFIKSKMINLPWYHYYFLDVYAFYIVLDVLIYFILSKCVRKVLKKKPYYMIKYVIATLTVFCAICIEYYYGYLYSFYKTYF